MMIGEKMGKGEGGIWDLRLLCVIGFRGMSG